MNIVNNFPETVSASQISLKYSPFSPTVVHGLQHDVPAPSPSLGESTSCDIIEGNNSERGFECFPFQEHYNCENEIILQPGRNCIGMKFVPPCCGEFAPSEIRIQLPSSVTFCQGIVSDLNRLHHFFERNVLVEVATPKSVLNIHPFPATFTPLTQNDVGGLIILPEASDNLLEVIIHAQCVSKKNRTAYNEHVITRQSSVSRVSDRASSLANVYENTEKDFKTMEFSKAAGKQVVLDSASSWILQNHSEGAALHNIDINALNEGIVIKNLPRDTRVCLLVPFNTREFSDCEMSMCEEFDLIFSICGKMIRNGCSIEFNEQVEQLLTVGNPVDLTQESTELFGDEYFCQCVLRNVTAIPWIIHDFNPSAPLADENEIRMFTLVKREDEAMNETFLPEVTLLHPGDSLSFAMHLRKETSSECKSLSGFFPIQRCHHLGEEADAPESGQITLPIYELYNATIFEKSIQLCPPKKSPLTYSLDYSLTAFVDVTFKTDELRHLVGEYIPVKYELKVIFPESEHSSLASVILLLSFSCTPTWAIVGKTSSVVECTPQVMLG